MHSWQRPGAINTKGTSLVSGFQSEEVCKCYIWIYSAHSTSSSQSSSLLSIVTRIVYTSLVRWLCWMCACVHCHTIYFFPSNVFVVRAYVSSFFSRYYESETILIRIFTVFAYCFPTAAHCRLPGLLFGCTLYMCVCMHFAKVLFPIRSLLLAPLRFGRFFLATYFACNFLLFATQTTHRCTSSNIDRME